MFYNISGRIFFSARNLWNALTQVIRIVKIYEPINGIYVKRNFYMNMKLNWQRGGGGWEEYFIMRDSLSLSQE